MATAAAAVVAKAQRNVVSHFMQCNAVSESSAVAWVPDRRIERRMMDRLVRRGVLVETDQNRHYLDVPAYDRWKRSVRTRAAVLLSGVGIAIALAVVLA